MSLIGLIAKVHRDDANQKLHEKKERQKLKSGVPQDNYADAYVDPVADATHHDAGKGSKIRDTKGWYSEEVTKTLENIFGKKEEKKKKAKSEHDD